MNDNDNPNTELELPRAEPYYERPGMLPAVTEQRHQITAAQAKVDAVAALTMKAYDRASMLQLSDEEISQLETDFPDEAFQPGAAGKEQLIYIQHAWLRDRLNKVFRPGQWSIIPRNRWAEDYEFTNSRGQPVKASRVYVEAMLVIRGCFVAEAVGEMEYYPGNQSQNYGDAVEGAKTAALRRCCKELGVGLQAWKKEWCEGWWKRRNEGSKTRRPPVDTAKPHTPGSQPASEPPKPASVVHPKPTAATLAWALKALVAEPGGANRDQVHNFLTACDILPAEKQLEQWPLEWVPNTPRKLRELGAAIADFATGGQAHMPYSAWVEPVVVNVPSWQSYVITWGKLKDTALGQLPDDVLRDLWATFKPKDTYYDKHTKTWKPKWPEALAADKEMRDALDAAGKEKGFDQPAS